MEIVFDKASKMYEPDTKVTGHIEFKDLKPSDIEGGVDGIKLRALNFMDTVSQIRGNMGRPPLDESKKIYFMKKDVEHKDDTKAGAKGGRTFEFLLEATEEGEKLIDAYVGVEFSIIVSKSKINSLNFIYL